MNDHLSTDQHQLEQATSRPMPGGDSLPGNMDAATAAARQVWLAAGAAAEVAGRDGLNEQALLATLQGQLLKSQPARTASEPAPQLDWSWAAVAVAATVLVTATIIGALSQRPDRIPGAPGPTQLVQPQPQVVQPVVPAVEEGLVSSAGTSSWNDLDEAIHSTYAALQQLSLQRNEVDQSLTDLDSQLKQFSADMAGESL